MIIDFVVPPLTGHVNPTVALGAVLAERGHEVRWIAHPKKVRSLLRDGATLLELDDDVPQALLDSAQERANTVRGLAALQFLWEAFLIPLAKAMTPQVKEHWAKRKPDLAIVDQQALGGAFAARMMEIPWWTSCTTSAAVVEPLLDLPKVLGWRDAKLAELQEGLGLVPAHPPDRSPNGVLVFSSRTFVGSDTEFSEHVHFVGPAIVRKRPNIEFPWNELDSKRKKVLVSLGTVNAERGERFYRVVCESLRDQDIQVILVAPESLCPSPPENFIRRDYVPQLALLPKMDAVISHGGHNTVCETLAHGIPLVVAPIKDDQPVVAGQVVDAGCGVRVKFGRVQAGTLRKAVTDVLEEPRYREAATKVAESFEKAGGIERAASLLEAVFER